MYSGSHSISMDAKGRIAVPTRVRELLMEECEGRIVVTANPEADVAERCLWVYPESQWGEIQRKLEELPTFNKLARRTKRLLIGHATSLELDGNGRVLLPPTLRTYAGLDKKLMLVGQGNKLELWAEERWQLWLDDVGEDEEVPAEMLSLTL
ncbi:MAG: division/cell wall cluster transcriptional repressor MraZ [Gammaproteobacteria bacterium]|uniref:division/cell wall cluster transcriptional repressor MraZ n=1 Tax=Pseudomaricurvus alcaniphilus TaxID=1166482 RepID=UPI00140996A3|nr:division/cell wall cluster transcriptional repressor MraZ [Gammaproteobacteria bacterium]NHN38129.1 division/cell wall cluster transcriptional repressor MraZ [Pseudomaricurvus alcaniphilus]